MKKLLIALMMVVSIGATGVVYAQSLQKGLEAYNSGDYAAAFKQWKVLAKQGNTLAQFSVGYMYYEGKGATRDYKDAVKWYRKAAEQGHADAQFNLGQMYRRGQGVTQGHKEAAKWYRKAAEQGDAKGQHSLGLMYDGGLGVAEDTVAAHMWFNIAAANGYEDAEYSRDEIASKLSAEGLRKAQQMAKRCKKSAYKDCD